MKQESMFLSLNASSSGMLTPVSYLNGKFKQKHKKNIFLSKGNEFGEVGERYEGNKHETTFAFFSLSVSLCEGLLQCASLSYAEQGGPLIFLLVLL